MTTARQGNTTRGTQYRHLEPAPASQDAQLVRRAIVILDSRRQLAPYPDVKCRVLARKPLVPIVVTPRQRHRGLYLVIPDKEGATRTTTMRVFDLRGGVAASPGLSRTSVGCDAQYTRELSKYWASRAALSVGVELDLDGWERQRREKKEIL